MNKLLPLRKYLIGTLVILGIITGLIVSNKYFAEKNPELTLEKVLTLAANAASVDYFLKIEGIQGSVTEKGHEEEIMLESFSWGATNPGIVRSPTPTGASSFSPINVVIRLDQSAPKLLVAAARGDSIPKVEIKIFRSGEKKEEFLKITLQNAIISSYQARGASGDIPIESVSLNFSKIKYEYKKQKGNKTETFTGGWDIEENRPLPE